jgi:NAD(P)-dependent dehydrogenase (short-subunit alcohol dehydrogenase family)
MSDLFCVEGRVALVTGGTSGIGLMIAKGLVAHGTKVYITSRQAEAGAKAAAEAGGGQRCVALVANLATLDGVGALAEAIRARESRLDILVNNAGAMWEQPIEEFSEEGWDQVMDLNLKSVFFLTQRLLPLLRAAASPQRHASVINVGSVGGLRVGPKENYSYAASKAALHHMTGSLAKRLGAQNVTVNAIAPGVFPSRITVLTDEQKKAVAAMMPRGRIGEPDDVVGATIYLASRAGSFVTGAVIPVAGGMTL